MAASVPVLMMPGFVGVLVAMSLGLVAVFVAVMAMRRHSVRVFVLMFVLGMAAHLSSLLSLF